MTRARKPRSSRRKATQPAAPGEALPVLIPAVHAPIKPSDLAGLFPDDEVKRLKLVVLTSAEPREKITAIRQLVLAPGSVREKGAVLLTALSDRDAEVRLEAIKALVPLGLNPDVAREASLLVSGSAKQQAGAAVRIGTLAESAGPGEVSVLLTLVAGTLRTDIPLDARRALIESIAKAAPILAREGAQVAGVVALLAEQLTDRPAELARSVHLVLTAFGLEDADAVLDALETESARSSDPAVRRVLLGALGSLPVPPERRAALVERLADELLAAREPERECLAIANCLCRWGAAAADPLLARLADALRRQKTFIVRILDDIAARADCPARTKEAIAGRFLALIKTEIPTVRTTLIETEVMSDRALSDALKSEIAAELMGHVHEYGGPRMIGMIETTVARLGPAAVAPLAALVEGGVHDRDRVSAARVLGELIARLPGRGRGYAKMAADSLMMCVRQLDRSFPDRDALAASIGAMCTSRVTPADSVRRVARGLRVRVGKEPYSFGLLEGLGRLAASPNVALATRVEVAESLLRLLEVDLPEMQSRRYTGGEKTIFIAGREAAAYTDLIPILLDGLKNVCIHAGSAALEGRVIETLVGKWRAASAWRLVWGPANTLKLAEVLGEIALGANATAEMRASIAENLATGADVLPVLRVLGRLFASDQGSARMGALAARVAEHMLARMGPRSGDHVELEVPVTNCLAVIAARKNLGPKDKAARLRDGVAEVLFKAFRNDAPGARQALRTLGASGAIGPKLRAEIESRLAQM